MIRFIVGIFPQFVPILDKIDMRCHSFFIFSGFLNFIRIHHFHDVDFQSFLMGSSFAFIATYRHNINITCVIDFRIIFCSSVPSDICLQIERLSSPWIDDRSGCNLICSTRSHCLLFSKVFHHLKSRDSGALRALLRTVCILKNCCT